MKQINIGVIGLGTVGGGVVEAIISNGGLISERTGISLVLKAICDKDKKALGKFDKAGDILKTSSADDILNDAEIDVVVELIGGIDHSKDIILRALRNKKHVVTANKALLFECWEELFSCARENGVILKFEASVGGGIPIIKALSESFVANNFNTVYGILNGTTNFILTMMEEKGCSFDEALSVAQKDGVAEKDPELDVSGKDSAHKLSILSLLGFGLGVAPGDIYTEGIEKIGPQDIDYASQWGYSIKLLAIAKDTPEGIQLRVHPALVSASHLLSDVRGVDNAIFVKGDLMGEALLFGKGAGRKPTSSSVIADITDIARRVASSGETDILPYRYGYSAGKKSVSKMEELLVPCYIRFSVVDRPGVLAGISSILAENNISIASVTQEERKEGETVPLIILTHIAKEGDMRKAISQIDGMDYIAEETVVIRIAD